MSDRAARNFRVLGHRVEQIGPASPVPIEIEGLGNGTSGPSVAGMTPDGRAVLWRTGLGRLRPLGLLTRAERYNKAITARGAAPAIERASWGFTQGAALRDVMIHDADPEHLPRFGALVYADGHDLLLYGAQLAPNEVGPFAIVRAARATNASDADGHTIRVVLAQIQLLSFIESELLTFHPAVRAAAPSTQKPQARPAKVSHR